MNCVLTDITQVKQAQEQQRLDMERCQIILNQTNDIIFEWDIQGDKITYSPNWEKLFGYQPLATSEEVQTVSHILPEDMPQLIKLMKDTENGAPYGEAELRIANDDGKYLWCRIRETTQYNSAGKAVKAVGVILNIDAEKRQAQALVNRAERGFPHPALQQGHGQRKDPQAAGGKGGFGPVCHAAYRPGQFQADQRQQRSYVRGPGFGRGGGPAESFV